MYVLIKTDSPWRGAYVAPPGSRCSYTNRLESAEVFSSIENAKVNACENESPKLVSDIVGARRRRE